MKLLPLILSSVLGLTVGIAGKLYTLGSSGLAASPTVALAEARLGVRGDASRTNEEQGFRPASADTPMSRLVSALQQPVRLRQRVALSAALSDVRAEDLTALVKQTGSLPKEMASALLPVLVKRWFELAPDAAQAWALASSMESSTIQAWAQANPESAIRAASASEQWWSSLLLTAALDALYGKDVAAMLARARTLPAGYLQQDTLDMVMRKWAEQDPVAAFAGLDGLPLGQMAESVRRTVLNEWTKRDPAGALAKLKEILPTIKAGVLGNRLVTETAEIVAIKDPLLALNWLRGLPNEFSSVPTIGVARRWAEKEPLAALKWCIANDVDVARMKPLNSVTWQNSVLAEAIERAPAETIAWVEAFPPGAERERILECAFQKALWGTSKEQLFGTESGLAWRLFNQMPAEAQAACAGTFGQVRAEQGDLKDLNLWANNFGPGLARSNAIAGAVSAIYRRDASRVEPLLATVTASADRDAALRGLASSMGYSAPADAAARALEIRDTTVRQETLEEIVLAWIRRDPESSREWLREATSVPAELKQAWLRKAEVKDTY
ncbi:hypothetical protein ACXR0O_23255 [Verrucomicrobiota bacterium sgz303538]